MAQGESEYSKIPKKNGVNVRAKALNSRSNPPDMVVLKRQSKPKKIEKDRYRHHDRTAFNARNERRASKGRGAL